MAINPSIQTWRKPLAVLFGLALLALAGYGLFRPAPPAASNEEALREQLELRSGKLCLKGTEIPFTGQMIERYPTGQLKCRSAISAGLLEGLSVGWHTNGQKQIVERFHTNVSHGLRLKWHENGQKLSEANIVAGKIEGVFRRWHANGALAEEIPMKAGLPEGVARSFYPDGRPKAEVTLRQGQTVSQRQWPETETRKTEAAPLGGGPFAVPGSLVSHTP